MRDLDKKYPLRLDTRINFKNLIPHFYISDNQTNDFYIKLTNDNKPVEVEAQEKIPEEIKDKYLSK